MRKRIFNERESRRLRKRIRLRKVLNGLKCNLSLKDIHYKTGLSEKNIRKIMQENPEEITFALLQRTNNKGEKK